MKTERGKDLVFKVNTLKAMTNGLFGRIQEESLKEYKECFLTQIDEVVASVKEGLSKGQ